MRDKLFDACFLGAYGENDDIVERLLTEFIRDHVFWRRNFHPDDQPPIGTMARHQPEYQAFVGDMRRELHKLSAQLKHSVPFYNPRYIGHMASDLLLPGLLAQLITTFYNPNNVVEEAAPVTLGMEAEVGLQLAEMLGFNVHSEREPRAWGHLTSGGTLANFESLWMTRAVRLFPLVLSGLSAAEREELQLPPEWRDIAAEGDSWSLVNRSMEDVIELRQHLMKALERLDAPARARLYSRLHEESPDTLGEAVTHRRHDLAPGVVIVPSTAHYSWVKGMKLLGLGSGQLWSVPTQANMRMDTEALDESLALAYAKRIPVLAVVGVLGTTEFGTIDPIHKIVGLRDKWRRKGLEFCVHVDAAWGGYMASLFRNEDGSLRKREHIRESFRYFPSPDVYSAFGALAAVDTVTVDPHKLGYLPYGAGAFVARNRGILDFVSQEAAYLFDTNEGHDAVDPQHFRRLSQFALEGSKPGAVAAGVYVAHKVLPLNHAHFGRIPAHTIAASEYFYDHIDEYAETLRGIAHLILVMEPDTNLVCLAFNPQGNKSAAHMNAFARKVYANLKVDKSVPVQSKEFIGSCTTVFRKTLKEDAVRELCTRLDLDQATFVAEVTDADAQADGLFVFRHTLMNPWLMETDENGQNYIDRYLVYLVDLIKKTYLL